VTATVSALENRVHESVLALQAEYVQRLQELVRIPSPIGHEGDVQRVVTSAMRDLDLNPDVFDVDPVALAGMPGFNPTPREYHGRPCVVGVLKGAGGGRSLILNGHIDTAPVEDERTWVHPPYAADIEDGKLYGRGAWDDKAGVVECLLVAGALRRAGVQLKGDLILKSVVEDETTGNGTLACLARGYTADAAIIVDGTWPERFIVSHMGGVWFRITVGGGHGHGGSQRANPADAIGPIVTALRRLAANQNDGRDTRWGDADRPAYVNIGRVACGLWPGAIPRQCVIEGLYGFPPPVTSDGARRQVVDAMEALASGSDWPFADRTTVEFWGLDVSPVAGSPDNDIARMIVGTVDRLHGRPGLPHVVAGHCDVRHYTHNRWTHSIPACLYGPGGGRNAHADDEYFLLEHLPLVGRNLTSVVVEWCGV
jgi:acetylornithine deacetylase